jgi:hypothetical protein
MKESKQRQSQIPFSLALQLFCLLLLLPQCVAHCDWCKQFANGPVTQQGTFQVVVGQNASTNPATMCKETVGAITINEIDIIKRKCAKLITGFFKNE